MIPLKRCDFLSEEDRKTREAVLPLLSNNGKTSYLIRSNWDPVSFDIVEGKHLLICCVNLPLDNNESYYFESMIDAYNNLPPDKFEMVIVATSGVDELDFNNFFSPLPCLAIPFRDTDTRDSICSFIDGHLNSSRRHKLSAILFDPEGNTFQGLSPLYCFMTCGYEWFPFRPSDKKAIDMQDHVLRFRLDPFFKERNPDNAPEAVMRDPKIDEPLSLYRDILLCDPSLVLKRNGYYEQSLTVSELSEKHLAIYLCFDGHIMPELITLHQECIAKKQELEILLVCIPLYGDRIPLNEQIIRNFRHFNVTSWFVFPEPNKVWRRLWRIFSLGYPEDRLIILPPNGKPGEIEGRGIIDETGNSDYPFTRSTILERRFTSLRSLTPLSLFRGTSKNRTSLVRKGKKLKVLQSALQGKKLLVYLDWLSLSSDYGKLCDLMIKLYPRIRAMGWEVVFFPLDDRDDGQRHINFGKMLWPIMPVSAAVRARVTNQLFFEGVGYYRQVIAFREDGKIVSREVEDRLSKRLLNDSLFSDNLYEQIKAELVLFYG